MKYNEPTLAGPERPPLRPAEGSQKANGDSFRLIIEGVGTEHRELFESLLCPGHLKTD